MVKQCKRVGTKATYDMDIQEEYMANQTPDQKAPDRQAKDTEQKQKELQGIEPKRHTKPPPNQNAGKGAPVRHPHPDNADVDYKKEEDNGEKDPLTDGKGTRNRNEDAQLVKEEIRSRDA